MPVFTTDAALDGRRLALRLEPFTEHILRVSAGFGPLPGAQSLMIDMAAPTQPIAAATEQSDQTFTLTTGGMTVTLDRKHLALTVAKPDGTPLLQTPDCFLRLFARSLPRPRYHAQFFPDTQSAADPNDPAALYDVDSGGAALGFVEMTPAPQEALPGIRYRFRFRTAPGEEPHGLGGGQTGAFNRAEGMHCLWQENMLAPVPFLVSEKGWGLLFDTLSCGAFYQDHGAHTFDCDAADSVEFYILTGEGYDALIKGFRMLTGKASLMPKWLLGYIQSRERYPTQRALLETLAGFRSRGIPLDLIVQDWCYWPKNTWSDKSFDPVRYPDPKGMCRTVHDAGARIMLSVWPNTRGGKSSRQLAEADGLLGDGQVYDAFSKTAGEVYWQQLQPLYDMGFDAWWADCSEPYEAGWADFLTPDEQLRVGLAPFKNYFDPRLFNGYALYHSKNIYDNQRQSGAQKRVVNLTRSGTAGQQRYGSIVWSGDIAGTWAQLRKQVGEGLNFCASGMPWWSNDAGGFFVKTGDRPFNEGCEYRELFDKGYSELYVRWLQYAAFLPIMRSHGTDQPREPWHYGQPGDGLFYDALTEAIRLRYRLAPYLYSLCREVYAEDSTLHRLLGFDFAHDPGVRGIADEFMLGRALLCCPVLEPQYFTAGSTPLEGMPHTREVYLPAGADWFDFYTGVRCAGGQTLAAQAPLHRAPLFVRGGSLLPLAPVMQYTDEDPAAPLEWRIYPGADAAFTFYEDEGDGYAYEQGAFALTCLRWDDAAGTLHIGAREGAFPGLVQTRDWEIRSMAGGQSVRLRYTGEALEIAL
ncbi:MAG: DUF5110 domain-containing protein [Oscillospiraceae bacterium]|jgi:alpha-D-xyloside xylohydrolase|nr:DUF5110 domain-containing protein [Oscillospiraceae bacterium]